MAELEAVPSNATVVPLTDAVKLADGGGLTAAGDAS